MHIATLGFWDLNFNLFFLLVLNAHGKCLFKKKKTKEYALHLSGAPRKVLSEIRVRWIEGFCFLAAEFIRCAQLIFRIWLRGPVMQHLAFK